MFWTTLAELLVSVFAHFAGASEVCGDGPFRHKRQIDRFTASLGFENKETVKLKKKYLAHYENFQKTTDYSLSKENMASLNDLEVKLNKRNISVKHHCLPDLHGFKQVIAREEDIIESKSDSEHASISLRNHLEKQNRCP